MNRSCRYILILIPFYLASALCLVYSPRHVITMLSAGIAFGSLSSIVLARRLMFLAAAIPHAALLSVLLAIPISMTFNVDTTAIAIALCLPMVMCVGIAIDRGLDPDTATAIFVASTASLSVIAMYIALTRYPLSYSLWSYIVGDPLLATDKDAILSLCIAIGVALAVRTVFGHEILSSIDRELAILYGARPTLYTLVIYGALAIACVSMVKFVGFVVQHILILLPATIASMISESCYSVLTISVSISSIAALAGLALAIPLDQAPAGLTGLLLLALYLLTVLRRWRRG